MERLQPEIIVSYLQASLKIFGIWAASFADSWTDNALTTLQTMVEHLLEAVESYTLHADVEVRERVRSYPFRLYRYSFSAGVQFHSAVDFCQNGYQELWLVTTERRFGRGCEGRSKYGFGARIS
jgi:hypothetical protein